jgi:hypothetical protein
VKPQSFQLPSERRRLSLRCQMFSEEYPLLTLSGNLQGKEKRSWRCHPPKICSFRNSTCTARLLEESGPAVVSAHLEHHRDPVAEWRRDPSRRGYISPRVLVLGSSSSLSLFSCCIGYQLGLFLFGFLSSLAFDSFAFFSVSYSLPSRRRIISPAP